MNELPKERFRQFVKALLVSKNATQLGQESAPPDEGAPASKSDDKEARAKAASEEVKKVFLSIYGDKFKTFDAFEKKFATFTK